MDRKANRTNALFTAPAGNPREGGPSSHFVAASDYNAFYRTDLDASKRPALFNWTWDFDATGKPNTSLSASLPAFRADSRYKTKNYAFEANSLSFDGPQPLFRNDADFRLAPNAAIIGKGGKQPTEVENIAKELSRAVNPPNIGAF